MAAPGSPEGAREKVYPLKLVVLGEREREEE